MPFYTKKSASGEFLAKLDSSQLKKKSAYLYIPKFKISASLQLQDRLKELGTSSHDKN